MRCVHSGNEHLWFLSACDAAYFFVCSLERFSTEFARINLRAYVDFCMYVCAPIPFVCRVNILTARYDMSSRIFIV